MSQRSNVEPWPMTDGEKALSHLHLLDPEDTSYLLPLVVEVTGPNVAEVVPEAAARVLNRHAVLRSRPEWDERPVWVPGSPLEGTVVAASSLPGGLEAYLAQQATLPIACDAAPCRFGVVTLAPGRCVVWVVLHHMVADLHTAAILLQEFRLLLSNEDLMPTVAPSTLVQAEVEYLASPDAVADEQYWAGEVAALPPYPPTERSDGLAITVDEISSARLKALTATARSLRRPFASLVQTAYCLALHELDERADISLGVTYNIRRAAESMLSSGYGVNTVPLRSHLTSGVATASYLDEMVERSRAASRHQRFPTSRIAALRDPPGARDPLFDDLLVYAADRHLDPPLRWLLAADQGVVSAGDFELARLPASREAIQARTILTVVRDARGLLIWLEYDPGRLRADQAQRLAAHFKRALSNLLDEPAEPIHQLAIGDRR